MVWAFVFVLLGACTRAEGTNAGLKGRVTQKGLEYGLWLCKIITLFVFHRNCDLCSQPGASLCRDIPRALLSL